MASRLEPILLGLCLASWLLALLHLVGLLRLAGGLDLSLYGLYSTAAAAGWVAGNVYVRRRRRLPQELRGRLLTVYLVGPPGVIYLLRAMAPAEQQMAAPLVPIYSFFVYTVLFLVPLTLTPKTAGRGDG